jgi:hypothetical protein
MTTHGAVPPQSENNKTGQGFPAQEKSSAPQGSLTLSAGSLEYLSREKFNPTQSKISQIQNHYMTKNAGIK